MLATFFAQKPITVVDGKGADNAECCTCAASGATGASRLYIHASCVLDAVLDPPSMPLPLRASTALDPDVRILSIGQLSAASVHVNTYVVSESAADASAAFALLTYQPSSAASICDTHLQPVAIQSVLQYMA